MIDRPSPFFERTMTGQRLTSRSMDGTFNISIIIINGTIILFLLKIPVLGKQTPDVARNKQHHTLPHPESADKSDEKKVCFELKSTFKNVVSKIFYYFVV